MSGSDLHNTGCYKPENTKMLTIDDLPEEVLQNIFSYLLLPARKNVRLVNKLWNELCNSARLTKHETFRVKNIGDLDQTHISTTFVNLQFERIKITRATLQLKFWRAMGCRVKSLMISNCVINGTALNDIINYCPNIEYLYLSLVYARFRPDGTTCANISWNNLENLVGLEIKHIISKSSGLAVNISAINVPKLKHLAMTVVGGIDENDPISTDTMSLIERQSQTLETLCFRGCSFVDDSFLDSLGERVGVQLTGLYIAGCYVTDKFLFAIAKKFVNLERLDISENHRFGRNIKLCCTLFSNLKKLKLVDFFSTSITDNVLTAVTALEQIEGIDLCRCKSLTAKGILRALGKNLHDKLLDIRLGFLSCITDEVLAQILPQLPNLRSIDLSGCNKISAVGVSAITTNCKLLRVLSLRHCSNINSLTAPEMNGIKGLLYLNLSHCPLDEGAVGKLKYLDLQGINLFNVPLTVDGLQSLLVNCPSLQHVELSEDLDLASVKQNVALETGRKCPTFVIFSTFYPQSIFELSERHFNRFLCNRLYCW